MNPTVNPTATAADRAASSTSIAMTADYLAKPELARLWAAARACWERNGGQRGDARISGLTEDEAFALDGLLTWMRNRPRPGGTVTVPLARLDERLRSSGLASSLGDVLERLGGPLTDRPAQRAAQTAAWDAMWEQAARHPAAQRPVVTEWLAGLRRSGALKRSAPGAESETLSACLDVLAALPRDGVELSRLASELLGKPHALDYESTVGPLTASALAAEHGRTRPRNAAAFRAEWAAAGVLCDSLSCNVLVLGLRPTGHGPVAQSLRLLADAGEPAVITLRQMAREPLSFEPETVFVCENPSVVNAAAEQLADRGRPLVCGSGWPNTAVGALLRQLRASGCQLRYQGDFDPEGIRIAEYFRRQHSTQSWRFDRATYVAAIQLRGSNGAVAQRPREDLTLDEAQRAHGMAVYEEDVLDELLDDLRPGHRRPAGDSAEHDHEGPRQGSERGV